jgi:hypothetical protein
MKEKKHIFAALIVGATATTAFSQTVDSSWYVVPNVNFVIDSPHREAGVGWATELALGKVLNDRWSIELGGQFVDFGAGDKQANVGLDALYFFDPNPYFSPFATLGSGYVYEGSSPAQDRNKDEELMLRGGLGFTTKISKNIDFRMDGRYQWHGARSGAPSLSDWFIAAGVNVYFR